MPTAANRLLTPTSFQRDLVIGTHNRKKGAELAELLAPYGYAVVTLADVPGAIEVVEDGATFAANAALKASRQAQHLGRWVLADDSGLEVDALGGAPGVYSARFATLSPLPVPVRDRERGCVRPGEGLPLRTHGKPLLAPEFRDFARKLRQQQTDTEKLMWGLLRDRRLGGFKFRRQYPIDPYALDFYCHEAKLAVELDGSQHNTEQGKRHDDKRAAFLAKQDIRVLRYWDHEVLQETESVLEAIFQALSQFLASERPEESATRVSPSAESSPIFGPTPGLGSALAPLPSPDPSPGPGEGNRDEANNRYLLERLAETPLERRIARYVCHVALADPTGTIRAESEEYCGGRIRLEATGTNGFGYDPLFEVVEYHRTFGELGARVKRAISHRARALRAILPQLVRAFESG